MLETFSIVRWACRSYTRYWSLTNAIAYGATILEKRLTLSRKRGESIQLFLEPKEIKQLVIESFREWKIGNIKYDPTKKKKVVEI